MVRDAVMETSEVDVARDWREAVLVPVSDMVCDAVMEPGEVDVARKAVLVTVEEPVSDMVCDVVMEPGDVDAAKEAVLVPVEEPASDIIVSVVVMEPGDDDIESEAVLVSDAEPVVNDPVKSISFYSITKMCETPYLRGQESSRRKRKVAHATVLTSSPYKKELESARTNQLAKTPKVGKRQRAAAESGTKSKTNRSITKKAKKTKGSKCTQATANNDDTVPCLYCGDLYADSAEPWIQCQSCLEWAHIGCAGASDSQHSFICERCA